MRQRQSLEPLRFRVHLGPGFRSSLTGLYGKRGEPSITLPASFLALVLLLRMSGMRHSRLDSLHSLQSSGDGSNLVVLMVVGGLAHCLICSSVHSPRENVADVVCSEFSKLQIHQCFLDILSLNRHRSLSRYFFQTRSQTTESFNIGNPASRNFFKSYSRTFDIQILCSLFRPMLFFQFIELLYPTLIAEFI